MPVTLTPTAGNFYRARTGDTLLGLVGSAYGVGAGAERLRLTKTTNAHPFNWRLRRDPNGAFETNNFANGIIRLANDSPCPDADYDADPSQCLAAGNCRPLIYIPPVGDIWFPPPPEVAQGDLLTCWAAALTSLSQVRELDHQFADMPAAITAVRSILVSLGTPVSVVAPNDGLRIVPAEEDPSVPLPLGPQARGEVTATRLASFMNLNIVVHFGEAPPGQVQVDRGDTELSDEDMATYLDTAEGPVMLLSAPPAPAIGHATLVFGISTVDRIYMAMDPLTAPTNGNAFGPRPCGPGASPGEQTLVLRETHDLRRSAGAPAREIFVFI